MASILTAKEVSGLLRLTEATIYRLAARGEIPGFRIGDSWRFEMDEILGMIQRKKERQNGENKSME